MRSPTVGPCEFRRFRGYHKSKAWQAFPLGTETTSTLQLSQFPVTFEPEKSAFCFFLANAPKFCIRQRMMLPRCSTTLPTLLPLSECPMSLSLWLTAYASPFNF